jgi:hypothetical protein|nr:MAG TPA: hypothetical protein [Caudoviricetes sp.]
MNEVKSIKEVISEIATKREYENNVIAQYFKEKKRYDDSRRIYI